MNQQENQIEILKGEDGENTIVFAIDTVTVKYVYNKGSQASLHKIYDLIFDEVFKQTRN